MTGGTMSLRDGMEMLRKQIHDGGPAPVRAPATLPHEAIREIPAVFQHRQLEECRYLSEAHAVQLAKAIGRGERPAPLDPVIVFWIGSGWVCIDGHHRLSAYRRAKWQGAIPVQVFTGTLERAVAMAARGNTKDRLPMDPSNKTNAAWRLVTGTDLSKAHIVAAAGVSDGTVGNMRRARKALEAKEPDRDLTAVPWATAWREFQGEEVGDVGTDWEEETEKEARRIADKLARTLGKQRYTSLPAFLMALEIFDARLPAACVERWGEEYGQDSEFSDPAATEECDF